MNISDRIQHLRKTNGISQEKLADEIGVSRQTISKWESEQSFPDIEKIMLMSEYFDVTTDYLIKGIEPASGKKNSANEKPNAMIFATAGTAFNFIGIVVSSMVWYEEQTAAATAIGLILIIMGCMIYSVGLSVSNPASKPDAKKKFLLINVWPVSFIILSVIYGCLIGLGPAPYPNLIPLIGFGIFLVAYLALCITVSFIIRKK